MLEQLGRSEGEFWTEHEIKLSKLLAQELGRQDYAALDGARITNYKNLIPEFESRPSTIAGISIRGEN